MSRKVHHLITAFLVFVGLLFASSQAFAAPSGKGLHHLTKKKAHERLQNREHKKRPDYQRFLCGIVPSKTVR
jgi:hypothetical protein